MTLARRLALVLALGVILVLASFAYLRERREVTLFERDMRRDHHILGKAVSVAVSETWRNDGEAKALELVRAITEHEPAITARWLWIDTPEASADIPAGGLADLRRGNEVLATETLDLRGDGRQSVKQDVLCSFFPVTLFDGRQGAIELQEPLRERDAFIHRSIRSTVVETVTVACICGIIATGLGISLVGKPVHALVEQARRVGRGDLSTRITQAHHDELGELAREMNAMCDQLATAENAVVASATARIAAVEQLRHADRLRTVGQLASGIAHELGTPLNVVSGRAKMIVAGEAIGAEVTESARAIVEQTERMTRIIRQLLDFARRREPAKIEQDLAQLARQTITLLTPLAAKRGIEIQLKAQEARLQFDSQQIQQALANLIMNAIQAMPNGGTIQISLGKRWVTPPADHGGAGGEYWALEVEDTGAGMPPEVASRAFEPFFTTKEVGEGTGLGLAVAYGMVHEHAGWIDLRSAVGQGSRFTIFLPGTAG